jgi:ABC-type sugar transport system substrate-binding protein
LKNKLIPAGQKGHIVVLSIDGDPTGLKGIRDGFIDADAENNPVLFAAVAVNMAIAKVHGLDIPSEIVLSPAVITKATVSAPERWGLLPSGQFEKWPVLDQSFFKIPASLLKK